MDTYEKSSRPLDIWDLCLIEVIWLMMFTMIGSVQSGYPESFLMEPCRRTTGGRPAVKCKSEQPRLRASSRILLISIILVFIPSTFITLLCN